MQRDRFGSHTLSSAVMWRASSCSSKQNHIRWVCRNATCWSFSLGFCIIPTARMVIPSLGREVGHSSSVTAPCWLSKSLACLPALLSTFLQFTWKSKAAETQCSSWMGWGWGAHWLCWPHFRALWCPRLGEGKVTQQQSVEWGFKLESVGLWSLLLSIQCTASPSPSQFPTLIC